ncbi:LuxR family maltose regulon positive regulatory protein [Rhodococcus sp. SMB37]|nr:LuxR family maltose regulon positive regulatory protein [Rhodococcus sp. SMB37]
MAFADGVRSGVPLSRSVLDAIPRTRLFALLDQQPALTVLQAPRGFGTRSLVASWLHRGGASGRDVTWVDATAAAEHSTADAAERCGEQIRNLSDLGARLLVVAGVPSAWAAMVLEAVRDILERCPSANAVVTLHGTIKPSHAAAVRDIDCRWIGAEQLCFTVADTVELCRAKDLSLGEEKCADLRNALSGVPPLVATAVSMLRIAPVAPVDADRRLVPPVDRVVDDYVQQRLAGLDDAAREGALGVAVLRHCTVVEASETTGLESCEELLERLDSVGLMFGRFDGVHRSWVWPAAVRDRILDLARRERPDSIDHALVRLAEENLAAANYADAAAYAVDGSEWDTAVHLIDEHWSDLVAQDFEMLVHLLRVIPDEIADRRPGIAAGRALFLNTLAGHPMLHVDIPTDPDELAVVGAGPDAAEILHVGLVQAIALRMAGSLREAGDRAATLIPLVDAMQAHQPHNVTAQLPTIRLQWAIGMQLAGDLHTATSEFELSYRDALKAGFDFVVLNAAGSIASNWAILGDPMRADEWITAESRVDTSVGYWDDMIRVGGRVARTLVALDRIDHDQAKATLDLLGVPPAGEELWGLVAYAHTQHALSTGDAYTGVAWLHRIIDGHRGLHQPGALSDVLLTATEIDLHLALGNGNRARTLAESDTTGHPLIMVATARVELLTGHPDEARAALSRITWPSCGWPRAHLEALLIEAAATLYTDSDNATRAWVRAVTLAETFGNRRVFATVPTRARDELAAATGIAVPDGIPDSVFPDMVVEIALTPRELAVLVQLDRGVERKDLADTLFVSYNTIKTQLRSIYSKLAVHSISEALVRARELGLLK